MNGVPGLDVLRSKSVLGLSSVVLIFETGTDRIPARQLVQERLARVAPTLPAAARPPVIMSPLSSLSRVMKIGMSSSSVSQVDLTTLARWTVRPRLMAVPGVANVAIWGQRDRQLQVLVDPDRLRANGVTLQDVVTSTRDAMSVTAGGLEGPNQRLAVTHSSPVKTAADLGLMAVVTPPAATGSHRRFRRCAGCRTWRTWSRGSAADWRRRHQRRAGPAAHRREAARGQYAAGHARRRGGAGRAQAGARRRRRGLHHLPPATFIEMSLRNLNRALLIGCVLVVVVLALFLWDWRTAVISLTAIPLSLLAAALVLSRSGGTLDTMVIAGLIIALGEVVDDAIIDVENIVRRSAAESGGGESTAGVRRRSRRLSRSPQRRRLRQRHRRPRLPAGVLPGGARRLVLPPARARVRARDFGVAPGRADRDAGAVADASPAIEHERDAPLVAWLKARYRRILPTWSRRLAGRSSSSRRR